MYIYRDTNEPSQEEGLPAEALRIGGVWIEEEIEGYRTLNTSGRDMHGHELNFTKINRRDGSFYRYKRFPERVIHVEFQLLAASPEEYREKFNKLNQLLNVENAELIFADEQDKCFYGTPSEVYSPDPGRDSVKGAFDITCVDPFKYSREEFSVSGMAGILDVDYGGTFSAYPLLEVDFPKTGKNSSCGYVAFVNDENKIIQVGSADLAAEQKAETLVNTFFYSDPIHLIYCGTDIYCSDDLIAGNNEVWQMNACSFFLPEPISLTGSLSIGPDNEGGRMLSAEDHGSADGWHGPAITYSLSEAASGHVNRRDFGFSFLNRASIAELTERGIFTATINALIDDSFAEIASFSLIKNKDGNSFDMRLSVNGEIKKTISTGFESGTQVSIIKNGSVISFLADNQIFTFYDETVAELEAARIGFFFGAYPNYKSLFQNGLVWAKFSDGLVQLGDNDVLVADCKNAEIYVNNVLRQDLGAIGNDWEEFRLHPGSNSIVVVMDEDSEASPSFRIRYREVYV